MNTIEYSVDSDGFALLMINLPDRPVNVLSAQFREELREAIERISSDPMVHGAILASGKATFIAGADLKSDEMVQSLSGDDSRPAEQRLHEGNSFNDTLRRLETCGKPIAVAINGAALGGGFEICLACHYRVLVDDPGVTVGLPEVTLGLLPGAGGTQRVPRLIGIAKALPILLQGTPLSPAQALAVGLVDELAPAAELQDACRKWLRTAGDPVQPWDRKGYVIPGGSAAETPAVAQLLLGATKNIESQTHGNYPAPLIILSAVYEGTRLPMDAALRVEGRRAVELWGRPGSVNMMRTMFINKSWLDKIPQRPAGTTPRRPTKIGVIGAGVMGGGIAYAAAKAGISVTLIDRDLDAAEKGKGLSAKLLARAIDKGRTTREKADSLLALIQPSADYADLSDCSIVIEAVFEDRAVKAAVTIAALATMPADAIFASNTSTLPITSLADQTASPDRFIGLHFFSPVDRMPLVEVIRGAKTSDETLAAALDLVSALRKTPIVVNDARGFFTTRCFATFSVVASELLEAGVDPLLIERAAIAAGMPVAPFALVDIMGADLGLKVYDQTRADLGDAHVETAGERVLRKLALECSRVGKAGGGGFYDYDLDGSSRLWSGLNDNWPRNADQPTLDDVKKALLYSQSLEAIRALDEGVLRDAVEGDVGSVIGWGFPAYTGGVFSLVDMHGAEYFAGECRRLAKVFGSRFTPPTGLLAMAERGGKFIEARLG